MWQWLNRLNQLCHKRANNCFVKAGNFMRSLAATELLSLWERGLMEPPYRQALLLLTAACPDVDAEQLATLSIGQRDGMLLELRERTFGRELAALVNCPTCAEPLELNFAVATLRQHCLAEASEPVSINVKVGTFAAQFRLPNSHDLNEIAANFAGSNRDNARSALLERCAETMTKKGKACSFTALPEQLLAQAVQRIAEVDSQANIELALDCPACRQSWLSVFDIVSFLWQELEARAKQLLREIHLLASTYHWSEAEILQLSQPRRQLYLNMVLNG